MAFYRLILILVHLFLSLKYYLLYGFELLWKFVVEFTCTIGSCNKRARIHHDSKQLNKLPKHLSFIIVEKDINFVDLAQMIVWSMAMGISYISIYDREGKTIYIYSLVSSGCVT